MAPKSTLETQTFNPFVVNENMNHSNQDPEFLSQKCLLLL